MVSIDEHARAIGAHGLWKTRLKQTIGTGRTAVRQDNQCAFGKRLHAGFLKRAARVADQALAGTRAAADRLLSFGGEYTDISAKLTAATMEWKKGLV